jgi:hypothetical protein
MGGIKMFKPITTELPDIGMVQTAILAVVQDDTYLVGPLSPEEVNIGVKAREGLMYASCSQLADAMTSLVVAEKVRIIFAAGAGEELRAFFTRAAG